MTPKCTLTRETTFTGVVLKCATHGVLYAGRSLTTAARREREHLARRQAEVVA